MVSSATPNYLQMPQQIWCVDVSRAWMLTGPQNMSRSYQEELTNCDYGRSTLPWKGSAQEARFKCTKVVLLRVGGHKTAIFSTVERIKIFFPLFFSEIKLLGYSPQNATCEENETDWERLTQSGKLGILTRGTALSAAFLLLTASHGTACANSCFPQQCQPSPTNHGTMDSTEIIVTKHLACFLCAL